MPVTRLITQRKFGSYIVWTSPKYICNFVKYSGTYVSVLRCCVKHSLLPRRTWQSMCEITGSLSDFMSTHHANDRETTKCERSEWLWNSLWWKETRVIHLNSIPIYFVAIILLCLYALHFVADSYKTGSTPIADFNKNGNCCLCLVLV